MANGNNSGDQPGGDWAGQPDQPQQGTGGGGDVPAATAGGRQYDGVHPFADNAINVGAFIEAVKLTFERATDSAVLKAFVALTLLPFAWNLFVGGTTVVTGLVSGTLASVLGVMLTIFSVLLIPVFWAVSATQIALERPLAHRLFDRTVDYGGVVDTIKGVLSKIVAVFITTFLMGIATGVGLLCCVIPGLVIAFLLAQAPYLVAVHDRGVTDALKESFERGKKHWHLVLMFFAPVIAIALIIWGFVGVGSLIAGMIPYIGPLIVPVFEWVGALGTGVAGFLLGTTAFANIDELEGIATIDR